MTLPHAEALALIDQLEERLRLMAITYPAESATLLDVYAAALGSMRSSVSHWHRSTYRRAVPDDPRCAHGLSPFDCSSPLCRELR